MRQIKKIIDIPNKVNVKKKIFWSIFVVLMGSGIVLTPIVLPFGFEVVLIMGLVSSSRIGSYIKQHSV